MAILWRVNPRGNRGSLAELLTQRQATSAGGLVDTDAVFGLAGQAETGQGSQTSDISASASAPAGATIQTGQGGQTSDAVFGVVSDATIQTGQGSQTSDIVATTPFVATIETGQGDQTSDISGAVWWFLSIKPSGWWDSANETAHPGASFWQLNPRANTASFVSLVAEREATAGLGPVAEDAAFTVVPWTHYADGFGAAVVSSITQFAVPSGVAPGAFGSATVYNLTQYLVPSTANAGPSFGTANVELFTRYLQSGGASHAAYGTAIVQLYTRYLYLNGYGVEAFGTAYVFDAATYVRHSGFDYSAVGTASVINQDRTVWPTGGNTYATGTALVYNLNRTLRPVRINPGSFGTAQLIGPRYIKGAPTGGVSLGNTAAFGTTFAQGPRTVTHKSGSVAAYGVAQVQFLNRTVKPSSVITPFGFVSSNHKVSSGLAQYAYPLWTTEQVIYEPIVGEPPFSVIEAESIDDGGVFGEDSEVLHSGPPGGLLTQYITKAGKIYMGAIPRVQVWPITVRPLGMIGAFGKPFVSNFVRTVAPAGFDALRTGKPTAALFTRYIQAVGFDRSVVWNPYGPIDENGVAPRVYNQYSGESGVIAAISLASIGSLGTPTVGHRVHC